MQPQVSLEAVILSALSSLAKFVLHLYGGSTGVPMA